MLPSSKRDQDLSITLLYWVKILHANSVKKKKGVSGRLKYFLKHFAFSHVALNTTAILITFLLKKLGQCPESVPTPLVHTYSWTDRPKPGWTGRESGPVGSSSDPQHPTFQLIWSVLKGRRFFCWQPDVMKLPYLIWPNLVFLGSQATIFHITCLLETFRWRCWGLNPGPLMIKVDVVPLSIATSLPSTMWVGVLQSMDYKYVKWIYKNNKAAEVE